jgi:hypothetical protein
MWVFPVPVRMGRTGLPGGRNGQGVSIFGKRECRGLLLSKKERIGGLETPRGGVNLQSHGFQGSDTQKQLIPGLDKDHRRAAHVTVPPEESHAYITFECA